MSLTSCLHKAKDTMNPADFDAVLARANELEDEGVATPEAERRAVQEVLDGVLAELGQAGAPAALDRTETPELDIESVPVDSFGWNEEDDVHVYHVTSEPAAQGILQDGFDGKAKKTFTGGSYPSYSKGKVFFTDRSGVKFWLHRVEDQLFDQHDEPPEVAVVRVPKSRLDGLLKADKTGTDDAKHPAWYVEAKDISNKDTAPDSGGDIKQSAPRPMFYSQLQTAIEGVPDRLATMAAPQWKLWLDANAGKLGVKKEEVEWSGVLDYLALRGKDKVTRAEVVSYLADNGVRVQETVLGGESKPKPFTIEESDGAWNVLDHNQENFPDGRIADGPFKEEWEASNRAESLNDDLDNGDYEGWSGKVDGLTKYHQYTLPGGQNYRELLITLPVGDDAAVERLREAGSEADYNKARSDIDVARAKAYKSSHWDQPNVLAHIRVDDRADADGKKVLMIQEIQSDWGQQAKKDGIGDTETQEPSRYQLLDERGSSLGVFDTMAAAESHQKGMHGGRVPWSNQPVDSMKYTIKEVEVKSIKKGVPAAPFIAKTESWIALALKRAIIMAAQGGYDKVAMVTGQQAADFFDLSKQVDRIGYSQQADGEYQITARKPGSSQIEVVGKYPGDQLADVVGKEVADKITSSKKKIGLLEGLDLKVGGSGMLKFYDELVPQVARDVLKKLGGGKMEEVLVLDKVTKPHQVFGLSHKGNGLWRVRKIVTGEALTEWMSKEDATAEMNRMAAGEFMPQPGFTITPAMREKVAGGLPLFSAKREAYQGADPVESKEWTAAQAKGLDMSHEARMARAKAMDFDVDEKWYHGTNKDITRFKTNKKEEPGVWFVSDPEVASNYAEARRKPGTSLAKGANVIPVFLRSRSFDEVAKKGEAWTPDDHDAAYNAKNDEFSSPGTGGVIFRDTKDYTTSTSNASMSRGTHDTAVVFQSAIDRGAVRSIYAAFDPAQASSPDIHRSTIRDKIDQAINQPSLAIIGETSRTHTPEQGDDIKKSTGRTATGADWDSPGESKFDDLVYKFQDKQIETKRVVEAIKAASGALSDDLNVYLNEELYHGRTAKRTEDFLSMELNPLIKEMADAKLTIADIEEFLHARHAKEANAVIAERNPDSPDLQDGGSGMTSAAADGYMASLTPDVKATLEKAAARVDGIIKATRNLYVDYSLESRDTVDGWDAMFQHYVPLQREDKTGSPGMGQGFSIKGKETKGRTGSTRKVVDILANIAMQRERAIVRGEKNRVAQSLIGLASANENADFWTVDEVPSERVFNPKTGLVEERADTQYKNRDNAVVAKVMDASGAVRERAVVFNKDDPRALRMAQALKNLDAAHLEGLMGASAKITRYFAAINTQFNVVFGVVNLVRDVQGAMLNLTSTPLANDKAKIAKYTASALAGIYSDVRAARKGKNPGSVWASLWDDFQEAGGQTGYRDLFATSADRAAAIQKALSPNGWMDSKMGKVFTANGALRVPMAAAQRQAGFIFDWLSDYNQAMENGVRLAAYKAGLERGLSRQQAASIAKNLTTNFNRKGQVSQQAGAIFAFFNAALQGSARIGQTLFDMEPGQPKTLRLSKTGKKIVYGGMLLGSVQALALAAAGFGDDDPPEFTRERSLIIPTGGKTYISIPMPLGMHVIPNIGRMATEFALSGFKDPVKRTVGLVSLFADAFNPIGNAGLSMQTLAPTALDPLVALTENKDFTGRPIAKTSFNKAIPGHTLGRDTSTAVGEFLSEGINWLSGGNEHVAGAFSPTPDQVDFLLTQLTGGVGRETSKAEQSIKAAVRGESLPLYKVPLVGRFLGNAEGQASESSAFYANVDKLNALETEAKGLKAAGKANEARELLANNPQAYLITQANFAENQARKLRKTKSELIKAGAPREQVISIEEKITATMARLNRAAEKLKEKPAT